MRRIRRMVAASSNMHFENLARLKAIETLLREKPSNDEFFLIARVALFRLRKTAKEHPSAAKRIVDSIAAELKGRTFDPHEFDRAARRHAARLQVRRRCRD